jgi:hypothetical protein
VTKPFSSGGICLRAIDHLTSEDETMTASQILARHLPASSLLRTCLSGAALLGLLHLLGSRRGSRPQDAPGSTGGGLGLFKEPKKNDGARGSGNDPEVQIVVVPP